MDAGNATAADVEQARATVTAEHKAKALAAAKEGAKHATEWFRLSGHAEKYEALATMSRFQFLVDELERA